ncbi:MAG: hypothetical protein JXR96_19530 [Deltaproteobacteria bacterium]|nr:hypothetical protein [Deltaproteobacteria bacterium]
MRKSLVALVACSALLTAAPLAAQPASDSGKSEQPQVYKMPTLEDWNAAGLDPHEYDMAVRYQVSIEQWKDMDSSRKAHVTAGWACIGVGILGGAVEATVILAGGIDINAHPEREVFIISTVAVGATALTGLIVMLAAPGPEDFKYQQHKKKQGPIFAFDLGGDVQLQPSPLGLVLTF